MSLFQRPAWSQVPAADTSARGSDESDDDVDDRRHGDGDNDDGSEDLFRHSKSFMAIMADSERQRREEKKERREQERGANPKMMRRESKRKSEEGAPSEVESAGKLGSETKRRRITSQDGAALLSAIGATPTPLAKADLKARHGSSTSYDEQDSREIDESLSPSRRSPRRMRSGASDAASRGQPTTAGGDLSSDDDIHFVSVQARPKNQSTSVLEEDEDESDPELAELKRKARAMQAIERDKAKLLQENGPATDASSASMTAALSSPALHDATVKILITSQIENTTPLLIYRKLSQRLQEVREVWCSRQRFSESFTSQVFLTYRGRRLFNVTTCRSLGLEADEHGHVTLRDDRTKTGVDQVHLEAVTQALFDSARAEKERQARIDIDDDLDADDTADAAAPEALGQAPEAEEFLRILVKAKGLEDFKLKVRPVSNRNPCLISW